MATMSKKDFYRSLGAHHRFQSEMTWAWFAWRRKNFDGDWSPKGKYRVRYDWKTQEIVATSERFGEDRFPASFMYEDEEHKAKALFNVHWYDGPLCGVAEYQGKKVWYSVQDTTWSNLYNVWTFDLYELSDEEYQRELKQHKWYDDNYDQPDYTKNTHLGLFDDCEIDWSEIEAP